MKRARQRQVAEALPAAVGVAAGSERERERMPTGRAPGGVMPMQVLASATLAGGVKVEVEGVGGVEGEAVQGSGSGKVGVEAVAGAGRKVWTLIDGGIALCLCRLLRQETRGGWGRECDAGHCCSNV